MISIGSVFRGPELRDSVISRTIGQLGIAIDELRGPLREGEAPWVNAVYLVSGSLGDFGLSHPEYGRFSAKAKGVVVQLPLPTDISATPAPGPLLVELLHGANAMAFHFFDERGEVFALRDAEALVFAAAEKLGIQDPVRRK